MLGNRHRVAKIQGESTSLMMRLTSPNAPKMTAGTNTRTGVPVPLPADAERSQTPTLTLSLKKSPSQKELAAVFRVTTRHLRRWEKAEAAAHRACSRPYTSADLLHLYQRCSRKGWDRAEAARLALTAIFERFDQLLAPTRDSVPDEKSSMAALMLKSIIADGDETMPGTVPLPRSFGANLAKAAREQLRQILECRPARDILIGAFFEAALVTEARHVPHPSEAGAGTRLSA